MQSAAFSAPTAARWTSPSRRADRRRPRPRGRPGQPRPARAQGPARLAGATGPDRLTRPLVRATAGSGRPPGTRRWTWIVQRRRQLQEDDDRLRPIGFYNTGHCSSRSTTPSPSSARPGSALRHMDGNTRLCTATAAAGVERNPSGPTASPDRTRTSTVADAIFLYGHNMAENADRAVVAGAGPPCRSGPAEAGRDRPAPHRAAARPTSTSRRGSDECRPDERPCPSVHRRRVDRPRLHRPRTRSASRSCAETAVVSAGRVEAATAVCDADAANSGTRPRSSAPHRRVLSTVLQGVLPVEPGDRRRLSR